MRPVLCLAAGEALGAAPDELLPAAAAVELAHTFGMVHDDLPALDDDDVRRGRATSHVEYDEATAILNGDALLAQAFELALSYPGPEVARELSRATLGMIGGQYDDIQGGEGDLARRHSLKTGRLFEAAVGCALAVAGTPEAERDAVAWIRVGVRAPVSGRGRRSRRRRARSRARNGRRTRAGRRDRGPCAGAPGRHSGGHVASGRAPFGPKSQSSRGLAFSRAQAARRAAGRARPRREPRAGAGAGDGGARARLREGRTAGGRVGRARRRAASALRVARRRKACARPRRAAVSTPPAATRSTSEPRPAASRTSCSSEARPG